MPAQSNVLFTTGMLLLLCLHCSRWQGRQMLDSLGDPQFASLKGAFFESYCIRALLAGFTATVYHKHGMSLRPMKSHGVQLKGPGVDGTWLLTLTATAGAKIGGEEGSSAQSAAGQVATAAGQIAGAKAAGKFDTPNMRTAVTNLRKAIQNHWDEKTAVLLAPAIQNFPVIDAVRLPFMLFQVRTGSEQLQCTHKQVAELFKGWLPLLAETLTAVCLAQMTVSEARRLGTKKLSKLLDALPEASQYFLVYCCDSAQLTLPKELKLSMGRLPRLTILQLNMQPVGRTATVQEPAVDTAGAAVAADEGAATETSGESSRKRQREQQVSSSSSSLPKPKRGKTAAKGK